MRRGWFDQFDARDYAQELTWFTCYSLRMGQMTGVLVGNALDVGRSAYRAQAQAGEEHAHVHRLPAESFGAFLLISSSKNQVVFVHSRSTTGRIGQDGINILRKGREVRSRKT